MIFLAVTCGGCFAKVAAPLAYDNAANHTARLKWMCERADTQACQEYESVVKRCRQLVAGRSGREVSLSRDEAGARVCQRMLDEGVIALDSPRTSSTE